MRLLRLVPLTLVSVALSGCGYIHFGRLPPERPGGSELAQAYLDLTIQSKVLKQELQLAQKENDALRSAVDQAKGGATTPSADLTRQLETTTRELATLRVQYAKLQAERSTAAAPATNLSASEEAALKSENAQLQKDLAASRSQNAQLAEELTASVERAERLQASLSQVSTALVDEKQARSRAEQATTALRAQLEAVMARAGRADEPSAATAPSVGVEDASRATASANPLAALQDAKSPPSGAVPAFEIRTSQERAHALQAAAGASGKTPAAQPAAATAPSEPAPTATAASSALPASANPPAAPETTTAEPISSVKAPAVPPVPASTAATAPAATTASASESAAVAASPSRKYVVRAGDTLEKIAQREYGATDQWSKIYAANAEVLSASQGLKPGMTLVIPAP